MNVVLRAGTGQQLLLPPGRWLAIARWRPRAGIVATGAESKKLIQQV